MGISERYLRLANAGGALLLAALAITAIGLVAAFDAASDDLDELRERNAAAVALTTQLRLESDDLTRTARLYAVTGDERFRNYFGEILDIRNGDAPRPEGYAWVYWDLVLPAGERPPGLGEALPERELRAAAGLTATQEALLQEAENNSNALVDLERRAFEAVAAGDRDTALELLHGAEYLRGKAGIMQPIARAYAEVADSRASEVQDLVERREGLETGLYVVLGIAAGVAAALAGMALGRRASS